MKPNDNNVNDPSSTPSPVPDSTTGEAEESFYSLSPVEQAQWDVVKTHIDGLATTVRDGTITEDDVTATVNALTQVPLDMNRVLNAVQVPEDAGEYSPVLERMLYRIPEGWGRWISCSRGWYPLLAEAEERMNKVNPKYVIQQVKEKFGELRLYVTIEPLPDPDCCLKFKESNPIPERSQGNLKEDADTYLRLTRVWRESYETHMGTLEHQQFEKAQEPLRLIRQQQMEALQTIAHELESRSVNICEHCGAPTERTTTKTGWVITLCENCQIEREKSFKR